MVDLPHLAGGLKDYCHALLGGPACLLGALQHVAGAQRNIADAHRNLLDGGCHRGGRLALPERGLRALSRCSLCIASGDCDGLSTFQDPEQRSAGPFEQFIEGHRGLRQFVASVGRYTNPKIVVVCH
ncbi:hypothetical protein D9M70_613090 [compost metagenome]